MRRPDWKEALRTYLAEVGRQSFHYGSHDCALFVAGAVRVQTGIDYAESFGAYDEGRAQELLASYAGVSGIVTGILGAPVPPNSCHDGDVVEAELDHGPTLGICLGVNCAFVGTRQLIYRPRSVIRHGWKVV